MKKKHLITTKYGSFEARIWYDKSDKAWLVETVGFNRSPTFGETLSHAKEMAQELIELLVECEMERGRAVIDAHMHITGKHMRPNSVVALQEA